MDLTVEPTGHRGHAADIARQAVLSGVDLVVTLGGDGTVNEVVNGLLSEGVLPNTALAVVPGGSTNVFARALGIPNEPIEATGVILEALREDRSRTVGLGLADNRYFTFCAGFGLDAAVIRRVERSRRRGRTATPGLYFSSAIAQYMNRRQRRTDLTLRRATEADEPGLSLAIVQNTAPWTYLGNRAVNPNPDASFELGLDVLALRGLGLPTTLRTVGQIFSREPDPHGKRMLRIHDVSEFTLETPSALAFQVDGDYLGERRRVHFQSVAEALRILC